MRPEPTHPESSSVSARASRPGRPPWTRLLLFVVVCGPALCIGGVPPWVLPAFTVFVAVLWWRLCRRSSEPVRIPWIAVLGAVLATFTVLQWLPIPGLRELVAPSLHAEVVAALQGTGVDPRAGLTVTPGDTGLEAARLLALTMLVAAAAQMSWRTTAAAIATVGTAVTLVGLAQGLLGIDEIWGIYEPRDAHAAPIALRGTFVNPNHQSGLLLLGIFCAAALARELHRRRMRTRDPTKFDAYGDWLFATVAAAAIQVAGLVLSLSRAGMLAGLVLGPVGLALALVHRAPSGRSHRKSKRGSTNRWLIALGFVLMTIVIGQHRAWDELGTLLDFTAEEPKYRTVAESLALIEHSPVMGIGRGGFIDLFPAIDSVPTSVLFTHIESAPVAMLVEWGPWLGGTTLVAVVLWWVWAFRAAGRRDDARGRRIALLGLLAVALQNVGDFSLEFLGVAAPACALAGALGGPWHRRVSASRSCLIGLGLLGLAGGLALLCAPATWTRRPERTAAMLAYGVDPEPLLRERPLDGRLHAALARMAAEEGDWERAEARARIATQRLPGSMDAWLVLGAARLQRGDQAGAKEATRRGLELVTSSVDEALATYLLAHYPDPHQLVELLPESRTAFVRLSAALRERAPDHADVLAAAWSRAHPSDPLPHKLRSDLARRRGRPGLAMHHARLLRQLAPDEASSYVTLAAALGAFGKDRTDEIIEVFETGLAEPGLADPWQRSVLEEQLLRHLLKKEGVAAKRRAAEVAEVLLTRPARNRDERKRREKLAAQARQLQ